MGPNNQGRAVPNLWAQCGGQPGTPGWVSWVFPPRPPHLAPAGAHMPCVSPGGRAQVPDPSGALGADGRDQKWGWKRALGEKGPRGGLQTDVSASSQGGNHTTPTGMTWVDNGVMGGGGAHVLGTPRGPPMGPPTPFHRLPDARQTNG